jgi:hypothetical protein
MKGSVVIMKTGIELLEWSMIDKSEEHDFQFSSKSSAILTAKLETIRTGREHQHFLTHTYRNLLPRLCWTICLRMHWKGNNLITKL